MPSWLVFLLTVAFAKGLVVLGLLVMMRAGLVSFGQGLYYGLGAYAAGLAANFLGVTDAIALVALGGIVSATAGYRARLRHGALSRNLLCDAEPRTVDDSVRHTGAFGCAWFDRRI